MLSETEKLRREAQAACERQDVMPMLTMSDELLRRDSTDVDAMFIAGTAFLQAGQEGMAALVLNAARCATKDPVKLGPICNNIGCALQEYQPEEAYRWFLRSLEYGTPPPGTYDNLCNVASAIGRHAEALDWASKSHAVDASYNKSFALMNLGRWREAWVAYSRSAGLPCRPLTERHYGLPRWDGKMPGRVVVHGEQGVGDEIMFLSMLPKDFAGVIDCNPRTADLFRRSFPQAHVYGTLLKPAVEWIFDDPCDWHLEMGGLGEFFAPEPFRRGAYLTADPARVAMWRAWLAAAGERPYQPRVGIAWTGGVWSTGRAKRSVPFEMIKGMIEAHPEVTWVNLEYEDRSEELADLPQVLNPHWATRKGADLDDLAALVSALDLTITATNSTIDLAGALGAPCWAMVDTHPQWRYARAAGENVMWFYESVRTFRQKPGDEGKWGRVVTYVSGALRERMAARAAA